MKVTVSLMLPLPDGSLPVTPVEPRLVQVTPGLRYTSETTIASTVSLRSTTAVSVDEGGVVVDQHSELVGPAAEHFAPAFGDALVSGVSGTVSRLAGTAA